MLDAVLEMLKSMGDNLLNTSIDVKALRFDSNDILTGMSALMQYLSILGIGLTLFYFLMDLNQKIALDGRDVNFKSFLSPFLKLLIAVVILANGAAIMQGAIKINNGIIEKVDGFSMNMSAFTQTLDTTTLNIKKAKVQEVAKEIQQKYDAENTKSTPDASALCKYYCLAYILQAIDRGKFFVLLIAILGAIISWIINTILSIVWWWKALQYKLELAYRIGYAPIAFADVYNGLNSTTIRYIKGFIAFGLYGAALVTLPQISSAIALDVILSSINKITGDVDIWTAFVGLIQFSFIAPFAAISAANAVKTVAREALGA